MPTYERNPVRSREIYTDYSRKVIPTTKGTKMSEDKTIGRVAAESVLTTLVGLATVMVVTRVKVWYDGSALREKINKKIGKNTNK